MVLYYPTEKNPFYFIPFHFIYIVYYASVVRNGWVSPSVGETGRPGHLSFTWQQLTG
jgi:hypothetical protein